MKFERSTQPVLPIMQWMVRFFRSAGLAFGLVAISLIIGVLGYHFIGHLDWVDAFLEASMILGGMGAIAPMKTTAVKVFAGCYSLFSGFVVLTCTAIILSPFVHRVLHHLLADDPANDEQAS